MKICATQSIDKGKAKVAHGCLNMIANTPQPTYYAVLFTSLRTAGENGYGAMAQAMAKLAQQQPDYLGIESARDEVGVTVSY